MLKFSNYIVEAKVSESNLNKVADIFKRIIERELKTKLFRFAGPKGFCEIKNGVGILYFYDRKKAIRLNYVKGEITSVTLWNSYMLGSKGDYTIDLGGLGLLAAGKELIRIIRQPRSGKITTYGELAESAFLAEAKRVSLEDFYREIEDALEPSMNISNMSWDHITSLAIEKDILIPTKVKRLTLVGGKGKSRRFDLTKLMTVPSNDKPEKDVENTYFIKVTAQDPNTKKFLSVKGDKTAQNLLQKISGAVQNPDYKKESKDPNTLFGIMKNLTQLVCRGSRNSLVIYGGPGIGKCAAPEEIIRIRTKD